MCPSGGTVSTLNERLATGPRLPTESLATTYTRCLPSASARVTKGELHGAKLSLSTRHSTVASGSPEVKPNVGVGSFVGVGSCGPESIDNPGALVSTVNARLATGPRLPAASEATTSSVCAPSPSWPVVKEEPQGAKLPASTRHSTAGPASVDDRANVGVASFVGTGSCGPSSTVAIGAVVSTVKARVATGPGMPSASVATTSKMWGPSATEPVVNGELQGAKLSLSTRHSVLAKGSMEVKPKVGVESLVGVGSCGPESMVTAGPVTASACAGFSQVAARMTSAKTNPARKVTTGGGRQPGGSDDRRSFSTAPIVSV